MFRPAHYVMITGDPIFSPNNDADIKYLNQPKNKEGEFVKVVLISKAAGEGVDFKNIRQVHVMEPWFNMSRIEQIIGRGVRNLSHCQLPFEQRNVEIYLHGTQSGETETADLYIYRLAEQKSVKIGKVTRVLKETAVDCNLNIAQTNFTAEKLKELLKTNVVQIETSTGETMDYTVGDKPFTEICDYMDNCNYTVFSQHRFGKCRADANHLQRGISSGEPRENCQENTRPVSRHPRTKGG
jgi:superfamily II DNA or RNA helicase